MNHIDTVDTRLDALGITVLVENSIVPHFLAKVRKIDRKSYVVKLRPGLYKNERDWVLFHEKGHILLDHNSNEWYDVSVVKDLMTKLRKSTRHVYEAASQVLNVCADCEVHTKLLGNDYEEMEIALSRLMKRRTKGSYWPTPEAYGFEPSKDAAFYLGSFVRDWDFARKIFEKRYPRFFV